MILSISEVVEVKEVKNKIQIQIPYNLNPVARPPVQYVLRDYHGGPTSLSFI